MPSLADQLLGQTRSRVLGALLLHPDAALHVREIARVYLNGRDAGVSTFVPHGLDVTAFVRPGENSLIIEVANTWLNRLIADDALPEAQRKTHTNLTGPVGGQRWRAAQPKPSGLLGPVRLVWPREVAVSFRQ